MNKFDFLGDFGDVRTPASSDPAAQGSSARIPIVVPGSPAMSRDENLAEYGKEIVRLLHARFEAARRDGKTILFDAATGSSPKAAYVALEEALRDGSASLDDVIVAGHEEAWGPFEPGSKSDLDAYRRNLLERNGIEPIPITDVREGGSNWDHGGRRGRADMVAHLYGGGAPHHRAGRRS